MPQAVIISIEKYESTGQYKVRWSYPLNDKRIEVTTAYIYYNAGIGKRFQKRGRGVDLPERLYRIMDRRISAGEFELVRARKKSKKLSTSGVVRRGAYSNQIRQEKRTDD